MSQPFDDREADLRKIAEKDAEIERLNNRIAFRDKEIDRMLKQADGLFVERQEKQAEIERLKTQHEEMLLKHSKEQGVALDMLEAALEEIARYKALLRRAAEALEDLRGPGWKRELIAELRKAARVE